MIPAGHEYHLLNRSEQELIHRSVLRILSEMGMQVQNSALLACLGDSGFPVDLEQEQVRFPEAKVAEFFQAAQKFDWSAHEPIVSASAGIYHSRYHDPESDELVTWDEEKLAFYFALARSLPMVKTAHMLGCRLPVPPVLESLYERYYCWKYGANEGGSIYVNEVCPYLLETYQLKADEEGKALADVFNGTVYLIPALRLGRHEAYQVQFFYEKGVRVGIGGSMLTMAADAPVTLAGAVTLNLAEQLALLILDWTLWNDTRLYFNSSLATMDMRTTIRPFGRPEMPISNMMMAQMARYYGGSFSGHSGLSDAKKPSVESGAQKAISAIATLLVGGSFRMDAGLLSIDEVCSPIQMVLDNEFLSALQRFTHDFAVDEDSIGLDVILEAGCGGQYLDRDHTAMNFRKEHWNPSLWSRIMTNLWLDGAQMIDSDFAIEYITAVKRQPFMEPQISSSFESRLLSLLQRALVSLE